MELIYNDKKFTSVEEVEEYDNELWEKYKATNYEDEKAQQERIDFSEAIGNYILDVLRILTIDLDEKKIEFTATDEEYEEFEAKRAQLQKEIIELGKVIDFWYEWIYDTHTNEYDLEKSYAVMSYYYRDYKDKTLFFELNCEDSPYEPWYNCDYTFSAVRRKPIVTYTYLDYDDEEVKNL